MDIDTAFKVFRALVNSHCSPHLEQEGDDFVVRVTVDGDADTMSGAIAAVKREIFEGETEIAFERGEMVVRGKA